MCGRNLGTITYCSVFGRVTASTRNTNGAGSAMGGICAENAGRIRACCVEDALTVGDRTIDNDWNNMTVGGIAGTNAVFGTIEGCLFYARYDNDGANVVHGAVCGANAGTVRNCVGVHYDRNYFNGSVGANSGTVENTLFPDPGSVFTNGAACYALNGGVTDGSQHWYQAIGTDALPQFSGPIVLSHGDIYCNEIVHEFGEFVWEHSADFSNGIWTAVCSVGHETNVLTATGTADITREPTCREPGVTVWTYVPPANDYGLTATNATLSAPAPLGHAWGEPVWRWYSDFTAASAEFTCSRGDEEETVPADVTRAVDGTNIVSTATVTHHGETFTATNSVLVTPWILLQVRMDVGGVVTLTDDVIAADGDKSLTVETAVTLDLAGHTLTHNGNWQVLSVIDGGDLTLTNSFPASGAVTGGGDHGVYVGEDSVFRLQGGAIAGNESDYAGGGVFVDGGTFEMTGGMITNNAAHDDNVGGGGVFVFDGTFSMTGGEISGNTAEYGGGVFVDENGIFAMTGGEISGNTADFDGGGVYVDDYGAFFMAGGEISGNTAAFSGGGVYADDDGEFEVEGSPVVSGNVNGYGDANNVYLDSGSVIFVNNLSAGASLGVTPGVTPPVTITSGAAAGDSQYFFCDNPNCRVAQANGEVLRDLVYPAYLAGADEAVTNNWIEWAMQYGIVTNAEYEAAFLLDISPYAEIAPGESLLKIVEFGTTNILVSESGGYGSLAQAMGYTGEYLTFRRIVLASDVTPLWQYYWGDAREVCNGYLVLRITADLSLPKSEWEAMSWPVEFEDGRAVAMFPEMFEESIRGYFEQAGGEAVSGLFLRASIETAPVENPALSNALIPIPIIPMY